MNSLSRYSQASALAWIIVSLMQAVTTAAVYTVGEPDQTGNCVGYDYCSIQQAIDAAGMGDTIVVAPGEYKEQIDFKGKAVTVVSQSGPNVTTIEADLSPLPPDVAVKFVTGEGSDSILDGFTIVHGFSPTGGGIRCVDSSPTIRNNRILSNTAGFGGGIYASASAASILDNTITVNFAGDGGGIYLTQGSTPTIHGNSIDFNSASGDGGGIRVTGRSAALVEENAISNNDAVFGGGICCRDNSAAGPMIRNNGIAGNFAQQDGGGLFLETSAVVVVTNTIASNEAERFGGGLAFEFDAAAGSAILSNGINDNIAFAAGGGISVREGSDPQLSDNTMSGNYGGAAGGGMFVEDSSPIIEDNVLVTNGVHAFVSVPTTVGGGIACIDDPGIRTPPTEPVIRRNTLVANLAIEDGAGIYLQQANAMVRFNVISANGILSPMNPIDYTNRGSGIFVVDSDATLLSNRIAGNRSDVGGAGIYCASSSSGLTLMNNMVFKNIVAAGDGAGLYCAQASPLVTNNTFAENEAAAGAGGGIYCSGSVVPTVTNTIVWDNVGIMQINWAVASTAPIVNYCDVGPNEPWSGISNVSIDPQFVLAPDDFHIRTISPCRNTGDNAAPALPNKDFDKDDRIVEGTVDRGADEVAPGVTAEKLPGVPPIPPQ